MERNQIKSTVDLVRLLQLERRRITLSRLVRSLELVTVGSPEEECFQAALESWRGTITTFIQWTQNNYASQRTLHYSSSLHKW